MKLSTLKFHVLLGSLALIFTGCASKPKYYWGNYENLIYSQYNEPSQISPELQIVKLETDIEFAKSNGMPLPPGFYAHLGYQYLQVGSVERARTCFQNEMRDYPESVTMMNRISKKLR